MDKFNKTYTGFISGIVVCILLPLSVSAQVINLSVSSAPTGDAFQVAGKSTVSTLFYDSSDAAVVRIAAAAFAEDIKAITARQMHISNGTPLPGEYAIIAGTIGQSVVIDELIKTKQVHVDAIKNKWEQFSISIIPNNLLNTNIAKKMHFSNASLPRRNGGGLLVITGSDRRGTAFGIFHLSRLMGVSPFVWWADIAPVKRKQLFVAGSYTSSAPSVQYRGIFINDEDWGLQPWAAKNMDTDIKDIGPKTYARVFELLLRLKANYIWPAMHPCTKAFYYYKQNPKVADDYAMVVGGSHCEPMLRNNVCEWAETYAEEYGKKPGEWRYDVNKAEIYTYWNDRIKEAVNYESVFTVGMRGVHDGSMPGPKDPGEKVTLLENVIQDQRTILQNNFKVSPNTIPQIFVPYKEVLSLYRRGLKLADDITIIWPDDNHGYIRQLPNHAERKRSGGHGVYYHLSYWGAPQDYLWLSSISPPLIAYEMEKSYRQGAGKLWVFNVGDIKPAEAELQFALDMAWDTQKWSAANAHNYTHFWAAEIFGNKLAADIAAIKNEYYLLAASGKPEHMNTVNFTFAQSQERIGRYAALEQKAKSVKKMIPAALQDAYFQLVLYPVMGAKGMNDKILNAKSSFRMQVLEMSSEYRSNRARKAFDSIETITHLYNKIIAGGKWDGIMSWHPRDQAVFKMPPVYTGVNEVKRDSLQSVYFNAPNPYFVSHPADVTLIKESASMGIKKIKGLGISGYALASFAKNTGNGDATSAYIDWPVFLPAGSYEVIVKCLPVFDVNTAKYLRYAIEVDGIAGATVNVHAEADSKAWKENVTRGYSLGRSTHDFTSNNHTIRLYCKDAGLVISTIEFYKQ